MREDERWLIIDKANRTKQKKFLWRNFLVLFFSRKKERPSLTLNREYFNHFNTICEREFLVVSSLTS